jgi:hypothetical protein
MSLEYHWSVHAYAKVAFHACKYLTHPLSGVLLGAQKDGQIQIVDAIPLFHSPIVASTMEVALLHVRYVLSGRHASNISDWREILKLFSPCSYLSLGDP